MAHTQSTIDFIHHAQWQNFPASTQRMARRCLLDLLGVAANGTQTTLSTVIRNHAHDQFGSAKNHSRLLFDGRQCSASGAALANGMTIDSIDAHDGYKPVKGHVGCGVLAALLALHDATNGDKVSEAEFLAGMVVGYEIGCRAGLALHTSVSDFHTSGAWIAVAAAAIGARLLQLDETQTRHALGIAEYHGPRSQMMRCIDHPTMLKDGSGWGAMAGVSAALLARDGFTGAPAITLESDEQATIWSTLGSEWQIEQQYIKRFPVCRWAQSAVVAALNLHQQHDFNADDIKHVRIGSFHESVRLATPLPETTEQAQYSLPFPVAAALVHNRVGVAEIDGDGLIDEKVRDISQGIELYEVDEYNAEFPLRRISELELHLHDGRVLQSGATEANGDPESPLDDTEVSRKFKHFATPLLGAIRSNNIERCIESIGTAPTMANFNALIYPSANS